MAMVNEQSKKTKTIFKKDFQAFKNQGNNLASLINQFNIPDNFEPEKIVESKDATVGQANVGGATVTGFTVGAEETQNVNVGELDDLSGLFKSRANDIIKKRRQPGKQQTLLGGLSLLG